MSRDRRTDTSQRRLATRAALIVITLSLGLTAFSYGGFAVERRRANFHNEPSIGATINTPQGRSYPGAMAQYQRPKDLRQQLEKAPEIKIQFDNSSDAPVVISAASVKAVKAPVSDARVPPNRYEISPEVLVQSAGDKPVTGLVLRFVCAGTPNKVSLGEGGLNVAPGADYRFKTRPEWDTFTLDGDPDQLKVSVAAVFLEGEDLWLSVGKTEHRPDGIRGTRSDRESSQPASTSEAASGRPGDAGESQRRAPYRSAKIATDAACSGDGCSMSLLKALGEGIGLPPVFEASVEVRIQRAGAFYLRNMRRGDLLEILLLLNNLKYSRTDNQLLVEPDDSPRSLHRLTLAN